MTSLPDIPGTGAAVPFTADTTKRAAWIQVIVTGSGTVRLGGAEVTSTQGLPIPAGGGFFYPWRLQPYHALYDLSKQQAFIPVGATLSIAYEPN